MEEKQSLMNSRRDINKEGTLMEDYYFLLIEYFKSPLTQILK